MWGLAYELPADRQDAVLKHLDFRERGGFSTKSLPFFPKDSNNGSSPTNFEVLVYIADNIEDNPNYLGPASLQDMAYQIYTAEGPSGKNIEYLLELAIAMRELAPEVYDDHLFELEHEVKSLSHSDKREESALG